MSLSASDLATIRSTMEDVSGKSERRLSEEISGLKISLSELSDKVGSMEGRLRGVERTVNAIETLPTPYGRPKTFVSATEFHSVSNPVLSKQGYQG